MLFNGGQILRLAVWKLFFAVKGGELQTHRVFNTNIPVYVLRIDEKIGLADVYKSI